jgi:hypothetical protein
MVLYDVGPLDPDTLVTAMQPSDLFKKKVTLFSSNRGSEPAYAVKSISSRAYYLEGTAGVPYAVHNMFLVTWEDYTRSKSWLPEDSLLTVDRELIRLAKNNPGRTCYIYGSIAMPGSESSSLSVAFQGVEFCTLNSILNAIDRLGDSLSVITVKRMRALGPYTPPNFLAPLFNLDPNRRWTLRRKRQRKCTLTCLFSLRCMCLVFNKGHCALVDCRDGGKIEFIDPSPRYPTPIVVQAADLVALGFGIFEFLYWLEPYVPACRVRSSRTKKRKRKRRNDPLLTC